MTRKNRSRRADERPDLIAGLRGLADFLEANNDARVEDPHLTVGYHAKTPDEFVHIAETLGYPAHTSLRDVIGNVQVLRQFGPCSVYVQLERDVLLHEESPWEAARIAHATPVAASLDFDRWATA